MVHSNLPGTILKPSKLSTRFFILYLAGFNIFIFLFTILLSTKVSLFPAAERFQSIVSTCAQIIAGLYGITAAGYTFFLSRIDALTANDATLDFIASGVKKKFKFLIWFITLNVLLTLFISIVLMYLPEIKDPSHAFFYRLFCNGFLISTCYSIILILYYSISVINPNCLEIEAKKQKKRLSRQVFLPGNAVEFITLYGRIEQRCNSLLPQTALSLIQKNKGQHFEYTLLLLQEQKLLSKPVLNDLTRIHRYYECALNCRPLSVSQEMCLLAKHMLTLLEQLPY